MNSINFFREQRASYIDRIVQWTLTNGRMIIMLTYSVALLAFIYRFTVDFQLTNLHGQIKNDVTIVKAMSDSESLFRSLQTRLQTIDYLNKESGINVNHFMDMIKQTHGNVTFTDLSVADQVITAGTTTNSIQELNDFVNNVKNLPYVTAVNIDNIQNKISTGQISAVITINTTAQTN